MQKSTTWTASRCRWPFWGLLNCEFFSFFFFFFFFFVFFVFELGLLIRILLLKVSSVFCSGSTCGGSTRGNSLSRRSRRSTTSRTFLFSPSWDLNEYDEDYVCSPRAHSGQIKASSRDVPGPPVWLASVFFFFFWSSRKLLHGG